MARIDFNTVAHSYLPETQEESEYALKTMETSWNDGGAYALLGPSGCGKTTLLNIISGLLVPSRGKVLYDGKDVTRLTPEKRNIAQVFQFPVLYDTMNVFDNLAFPLRNRGVGKHDVKKRVLEIADMLELTPYLKKKASGLSADAKQKISLGRGLVRSDVAAILFDEPLTVIDPHMKWKLRRKLKEIHERFKVTLIYVTHDQVEAMTFADKVVVMYEGQIVQTGTPEELYENPAHTFVGYFIGSPGMNFFDCNVSGNSAFIDGKQIRIDDRTAGLAKQQNDSLKIGIRPMYLQLKETQVDNGIPVKIKDVKDHGNCRIVTAGFAQNTAMIRVPEDQPIPQKDAWLYFPPEKTKLYSKNSLLT